MTTVTTSVPAVRPVPLYVATDLSVIAPEPPPTSADVTIDGRSYRRLDPLYYAWLRSRVNRAREDRDAGKLPSSSYDRLHRQFMGLHEAALRLLGEPALRQGCAAFDPRSYRPPGWKPKPRELPQRQTPAPPAYLYPPGEEWKFHQVVLPSSIAKVNAIQELALTLGWSLPRLYQNRGRYGFPLGEDYGLVCFVGEGECLGEVTARHVEIRGIPPHEHSLKYYNPDAEHPWNRKE